MNTSYDVAQRKTLRFWHRVASQKRWGLTRWQRLWWTFRWWVSR